MVKINPFALFRRLLATLSLLAMTAVFFIPAAARWCGFLPRLQLVPAICAGAVLELIVLVLLAVLFGRLYCSILCPLGILQDLFRFCFGWLRPHKRKWKFQDLLFGAASCRTYVGEAARFPKSEGVLKLPRKTMSSSIVAEPHACASAEDVAEPRASASAEDAAEPHASASAEDRAESRASVSAEDRAEPRASASAEDVAEPRASVSAEDVAEPHACASAEDVAEPRASVSAEDRAEPHACASAEDVAEPRASVSAEDRAEPHACASAEDRAEPHACASAEDVAETKSERSPSNDKPKIFRHLRVFPLRYAILALFLLAIPFGLTGLLEPYGIFGRFLASGIRRAGEPAVVTVVWAIGLVVLILLLAFVRARFWCNRICPVGTFLGLFSRFALFRVRIDSSACVKCGACAKRCDKGALAARADKSIAVDLSSCIACGNCLNVCPKGALSFKIKTERN